MREIVAATWPKDSEIKQLGEELATLNRKIQLTLKPVGRHESVEGKETGAEEQRLVSGSDVIPDLPRQAKHVPSMEIANPAKGTEKNILMFPAAIAVTPEATQAPLPQVTAKSRFRKGQRHGRHPDKSGLACRALVCQPQITSFLFLEGKAFHLLVDYLPVNRVFQVDYIHD